MLRKKINVSNEERLVDGDILCIRKKKKTRSKQEKNQSSGTFMQPSSSHSTRFIYMSCLLPMYCAFKQRINVYYTCIKKMDKYNKITVLIIGSYVDNVMIVKNKKNPVYTNYIYTT